MANEKAKGERARNVVQWVYASTNEQELSERYDEWAKTYDEDLDEEFGWVGPANAVETAIRFFSAESKILDAGAGTGLVGKLLSNRGYRNLVAMDLSAGMLTEARKKNAYQSYHQMDMCKQLAFDSDSFDGVVSVGVMTEGHAPASALDELVRVIKPQGHIVFTLRPDVLIEGQFKQKFAELEADGRWEFVEVGDPVPVLPKGEPDVLHQVWVYKILA